MPRHVNLDVLLELEVRDKQGRLLSSVKGRSRSLLWNFIAFLDGCFTGYALNAGIALHEKGGTDVNITPFIPAQSGVDVEFHNMNVLAGEGDDSFGIVVGKGTASPTPDDYKLESQVPHGVSTDQLYHYKTELEEAGTSGQDSYVKFKRLFENKSGGDISIQELGLYAKWYKKVGSDVEGPYVFLLIRDVLGSAQTIPAGATATVRYTIKVTT